MAAKQPLGDVVVLLPGILGSVLRRDGHDVWAPSGGAVWRALRSLGRSLHDLELGADNPQVDDLGDGVTATRLVPDVHLVPGLWGIDGYTRIKRTIAARFDVIEGQNWFDFPYDWRRDNRVAARQLLEHAPRWLRDWRSHSGNSDAKLVIVAHSMGGLVATHYLEVLGGWQDTRCLVTFGTPFRGSLNALDFLTNGFKKGIGPVGLDLTRLLRSLTSVYQLLPRYPCVDTGSGSLRRIGEIADLPGVDQGRAAAALRFHLDIDRVIEERGGIGGAIHPIVGILQPTLQSAVVSDGKVSLLRSYEGNDHGGDGTVPRPSATPVALSDQGREIFVADRHASIQNRDGALTQLSGILSAKPTARFRSDERGMSLDIDDLYLRDEPISFTVTADEPPRVVAATVVEVSSGRELASIIIERDGDGRFRGELASLSPGTYRLSATSAEDNDRIAPVTDLFLVPGDDDEGSLE